MRTEEILAIRERKGHRETKRQRYRQRLCKQDNEVKKDNLDSMNENKYRGAKRRKK